MKQKAGPIKVDCKKESTYFWLQGYGCPCFSITGSSVAAAEVAIVDASFSTFTLVHSSLAMLTIAKSCYCLKLLPRLTERDYGSDASGLASTTRKVEGGWSLKGKSVEYETTRLPIYWLFLLKIRPQTR